MCGLETGRAPRFVRPECAPSEMLAWGKHIWLSKPGFTETRQLLVVEVTMPPNNGHAFHKHPGREEVIVILEGQAQQWVDRNCEILSAGEAAFIPAGVVHAIYNTSEQEVRFLAILSPAETDEPLTIDMQHEEPWAQLESRRKGRG